MARLTMDADQTGFLGKMARASRARVIAARGQLPLEVVHDRALALGVPVPLAVARHGFDLIAEVKLRSPSEGALVAEGIDVEARVSDQARSYAGAGAAAISVLTEPDAFAGHLDHIRFATTATQTPVMRKDFLVDSYQIFEARAAGAAGVLLIVRILEDEQILEMAGAARDLGMFVLVECFDGADVDRVTRIWHDLAGVRGVESEESPVLLGVNCRDLATLKVEFDRLLELVPRLPEGARTVAESGVERPEQASALASAGYRMALVGSALMQASAPAQLLANLLAAGREGVRCASG